MADFKQEETFVKHSGVNGSGLWRAWQRSFEQKVDALLDLVDNAIDANRGQGRIRIIKTPSQTDEGGNEGILLLNSFPETCYKEMSQILQLFESEKDDVAIGENGVGTKQASAALSNFSVVVTKCDSRYQVGFLCTSLQTPEGIELPSYTFEGSDWGLKQMIESFCNRDRIFCLCLQYFGGRRVPSEPCQRDKETNVLDYDELGSPVDRIRLQKGRDRLLGLLRLISNPSEGWGGDYCVFALWLDQVRTQESSGDMLERLLKDLPRKYLHLQKHECDIMINDKRPEFQFWERRLVQLTCFSLKVSKTHPLSLQPDQPTENVSNIRIFVGFDPIRGQQASLYIHSRETGRLVQHLSDCRKHLGLTSGGTQFSQGLTIILDDFEASLPLTPTKQGIAWSDGKNGVIHKKNVEDWLSKTAKFFYNFILEHFGGRKRELSREIMSHEDTARGLLHDSEARLYPLSDHKKFSRLVGCQWRLVGGELTTCKDLLSILQEDGTVMQIKNVTGQHDGQHDPEDKRTRKERKSGHGGVQEEGDSETEEPPKKRSSASHRRSYPTGARAASRRRSSGSSGFRFGNSEAGTQEWRQSHTKTAPAARGPDESASKNKQIHELEEQVCEQTVQIQELEAQLQTSQSHAAHVAQLEGQIQHLQKEQMKLQQQADSYSRLAARNQRLEGEVEMLRKKNASLQQMASNNQVATSSHLVANLQRQNQELREENQRLKLTLSDPFAYSLS